MSSQNRADGAKLRQRYARHFGISVDFVELIELEPCDGYGERCVVHAGLLPAWTTSGPIPKWLEEQKRRSIGQ